jgi:hypothetical protein
VRRRPARAAVAGQIPEAARHVAAGVDPDRAFERPGGWIERVDLAVVEAEITDQKVAAQGTETGGDESDTPRRGELSADERVQQYPTFVENRHRSVPGVVPVCATRPAGAWVT